ncbi:hypothetical protein ACJMK2_024325, partial [Sinanodonta woodiana]
LLFGHCHSRSIPGSSYRYQLELQELEVLEKHIWRLIKQGLTWKDEYTQCVLQNVLVALQHQKSFNDDICKDLTFDWSLEETSDIKSALDNIYRKYVQKYGKGLAYGDIDSSSNLFLESDLAANGLTGNTNLIPGYSWTEGKKKFDQLPAQTDGGSRELFAAASPENGAKKEAEMALPPDYANLLGKLLQGEITPDALNKKELKYLSWYVSTMLSVLDQDSSPGSPDLNHAEAYEADGDETSMMKQAEHKEPVQTELEKIALLNNKDLAKNEQALIEALESDTGNEMAENIPSQKKSVLDPDEEEEIVRYPVPKNEGVSSSTEAANSTTIGKEPDVVNTDYAFIV